LVGVLERCGTIAN